MTPRSWKVSISIGALALVAVAFLGLADEFGRRYADEGFKRALVTFGVARGLNAVISVAQGTEVAMEPAGIGVVFAPGQILDPVNDLIERFSWIMLASTTSLGIQGLLLKIFASVGFSLMVAFAVAGMVAMLWWQGPVSGGIRTAIYRVTGLLLILRFLIPAMAISGEGLYKLFLEAEYTNSSSQLVETREKIGQLNEEARAADQEARDLSWYESLSRNIQSTLDSINIDKHVAALQNAVQNLTEHTVNLIVVFTLQTILFPLLFLWLAMKSIKAVFSLKFAA